MSGGYCRNLSAQQIGIIFAKIISVKFIFNNNTSSKCELDHDTYMDIDLKALDSGENDRDESIMKECIESCPIIDINPNYEEAEDDDDYEERATVLNRSLIHFAELAIRNFAGFC